MKRKIELLAPGGDLESIKAAIIAGANAIYCGLDRFNARNRAENITFADLNGIIRLAHSRDCQVFLTLNILIVESEIPALIGLLNKLVNTRIDGVIVQDLGLFYLLSHYFPDLKIHASTQLNSHNEGQIKFLSRLNATRANLSRELSLAEIAALTLTGHEHNVLTEVFVHGSYCLSFSGICYLSSVHGGNSGNRGRCSQPCRDQYLTTPAGKDFPLNLKDNSAYFELKELVRAGVDSIKIEGRIKKFHYVFTVVNAFHKLLQSLYDQNSPNTDNNDLYHVFNRDFSSGFLRGDIAAGMFIDNPRDNSAIHHAKTNGGLTDENLKKAKRVLYDLKTEIITTVREKIDQLSIAKAPLFLTVYGEAGTPLKVRVQTPETSFTVISELNLVNSATSGGANIKQNGVEWLNSEILLSRLKAINETEYQIQQLDLEDLQSGLFLPFQEITAIKKRILFILNSEKETVAPLEPIEIARPRLKKLADERISPALSLLIASPEDLHLSKQTEADLYFQLPESLKGRGGEFRDLFLSNKKLIPWFPSILIGEDYQAALEFLQQLQPERIVTNNTGIAYEAWQRGISWIAGPYLNLVNSFSLRCLKEKFNCFGAFISNELNQFQIKGINRPDDFKLYYRIYHPIVLMTSRQCLFHQVSGCKKSTIDVTCIEQCERSATITNLKQGSLLINKTKGNYHRIYHESNFLNTDIVTEIPDRFTSFLIDLRDIRTTTETGLGKAAIVRLFENHLAGKPNATKELKQSIQPSTNRSYRKGI
ncbi:MAG: U32 family peptidase [Proteobacteria bacterium]|nr:U32 family peptidase [Pseudomonadota bacterium]MBU1715659.1 U32 family peptidase [Pseudomonadota bacterium]